MNVIEEIKSKIDIVDLISEYIQLKPAGANFKALCPFHREKTPSFMVSPERQIWHCFGQCNEGGDIFKFIMKMEGVEFPEALRILANKANVTLDTRDFKIKSQRSKLLDISRLAALFYHQVLLRSKAAGPSRNYLKERKVSDEMIKEFQLGYAPDSWDTLLNFLKKRNFKEQDIESAGLIVKKTQPLNPKPYTLNPNYYDRFRNRLIFPTSDVHGNVVGFTGRILPPAGGKQEKAEDKEPAKYINSPETPIYSKSRILYGLDKAKLEIKKRGYTILVEGNMDVISSHQVGIANTVASSGTALTLDQVKLLKRYSPNLILAFDLDLAGEAATQRGIDVALGEEMNVKILELGEFKDPDECIKENPEKWILSIKKARPIMEHFFDFAFKKYSPSGVEGKKKIADLVLPIMAKLGNKIEQDHWLKVLAEKMNLEERTLWETLRRYKGVRHSRPPDTLSLPVRPEKDVLLAERLLGLAFKFPEKTGEFLRELSPEMLPPKLQDLAKKLKICYNSRAFNYEKLRHDLEKEGGTYSIDTLILLVEKDFPEIGAEVAAKEMATLFRELRKRWVWRQLKEVEKKLRVAEKEKAKDEIDKLSREFNELTRELKNLE